MKVFLDTNVLVSALATRGLCADVLREVLLSHQLVISPPLLQELSQTLGKKLGAPENIISEFIAVLKQDAQISSPSDLPFPDLRDQDDLPSFSSALNGETRIFVTGDKELLGLQKIGNMEIVSPREFWEKLKNPSKDK